MEKLNEFENYLSSIKQFNPEIDDLVDDSQSREELERQVMDNNYVKDRIEEHRMNESFQSDRSNKPVKALALPSSSKPNLYKPPVPVANNVKPQVKEGESDNLDLIRSRVTKQLEEFHKIKQLALADCSEFLDVIESK